MTALSDVRKGDVFLIGVRCSAASVANGLTVGLFGPSKTKMADGVIAPDGTITGTLTTTPDLIPVQLITGYTPIDIGDVLQNDLSGETLVCRWTSIQTDGTVVWSASADHRVIYNAGGWTVVGTVTFTQIENP